MKRFGKHSDGFDDVEARLRDERPAPSDDLVRRITDRGSMPRRRVPSIRIGFATALTACCIGLVAALGGLQGPVNAAQDALTFKSAAETQAADKQYKPPKPPKPCRKPPCGP